MTKLYKLNNIKGIKVGVILGVILTGKKVTLSGKECLVGCRAQTFIVIKTMKRSCLKQESQLKAGLYLVAGTGLEPATFGL